MIAVARLVTRLGVLTLILSATAPTPSTSTSAADRNSEQAGIRTEVRLRKLHLVRPDLIPYPIAYEVCC